MASAWVPVPAGSWPISSPVHRPSSTRGLSDTAAISTAAIRGRPRAYNSAIAMLDVDRAPLDRECRLLDSFGEGWMRMAGPRHIFRRAAELHQHRAFMNEFSGHRADDMHPEHAVGPRIRQDFDEAVGGLVGLRPRIGEKRKLAGLVVDSRLLQLLFRFAHRRHFRRGIDDRGYDIVIHMPRLAGQKFGKGDALILALMRQHRAANDIADRINTLRTRLEALIDRDPALLVAPDPRLVEAQAVRIRNTADRHQHRFHVDKLLFAPLRRFYA